MQCFAYAVSEMHIGRGHEHAPVSVDDVHDSLQRVLHFLFLFQIAHELYHLVAMLRRKRTFELHIARGELIVYAVARRTQLGVRIRGARQPAPSAVGKHGPALRTQRRSRQFAARLIGIMYVLFEEVAPLCRPATRRNGLCVHESFYASEKKTIKLCAGAGAGTLTQINQEALCLLENKSRVDSLQRRGR